MKENKTRENNIKKTQLFNSSKKPKKHDVLFLINFILYRVTQLYNIIPN